MDNEPESQPEAPPLAELMSTTDAAVWAREFMRCTHGRVDEDDMRAWFAAMWAASSDPLAADARRYRWIREHPVALEEQLGSHEFTPAEVDEAIDGLMALAADAEAVFQDEAGRQGIGLHDRSEVPAPHLSSAAPGSGESHGD